MLLESVNAVKRNAVKRLVAKRSVDILTQQKPDGCNKITVQFSITQMQYLYSGNIQI